MSNYLSVAVNPKTGKYEEVAMLDNYYSNRSYAILFKDGSIYPEGQVKMCKPVSWSEFDTDTAYKNKK